MFLYNQIIKDSDDYEVPLAGVVINNVADNATSKMKSEMIALWLENKGFTKDGRVKPEFIDKDYFHQVEEYSFKTGYSQTILITPKGLHALASTFKTDFLTEIECQKILGDEVSGTTEKRIFIDGKLWSNTNYSIPGQAYQHYDECITLTDAAKLTVAETYGIEVPVEKFMGDIQSKGLIDKYGFPSENAVSEGFFKRATQVLEGNWDDGTTTVDTFHLTLVTPKGLKMLREVWFNRHNFLFEL